MQTLEIYVTQAVFAYVLIFQLYMYERSYEGRSINKLQNSAIVVVFQI